MKLHYFTFNPFQENTFVLYDETKECVIIDPGCYSSEEQDQLVNYIEKNGLKPKKLVCTHFHLDHIFGNYFVSKKWGLDVEGHRLDLPTLQLGEQSAKMYGFDGYQPSPEIKHFIDEGDKITFGNTELDILFVPGHAPGHIALVHHASKTIINGDVLFQGSIGRTDLPGGDYATLENSIKQKMYQLPDDYKVYAGHGPSTTIGNEKQFNAFVKA
jgi:glyoxylase-like metal-dependent hydrolase (beta-lactamase superfamily II)